MKKTNESSKAEAAQDKKFPGYPHSPKGEDIYDQNQEEPLPEQQEHTQDMGLDVPGAEADDALEQIGEEDEENNYYSLDDQDNEDLNEDDA